MPSNNMFTYDTASLLDIFLPLQLVLLEVVSADSNSGNELSRDAEVVRLLVSIGAETVDDKNFETAAKTVSSIFGLGQVFTDMMKVWLRAAASNEDDLGKICDEISSALMKQTELEADLSKVGEAHPAVQLNGPLLALIRSKILKKKFRTFYVEALSKMVTFFSIEKIASAVSS